MSTFTLRQQCRRNVKCRKRNCTFKIPIFTSWTKIVKSTYINNFFQLTRSFLHVLKFAYFSFINYFFGSWNKEVSYFSLSVSLRQKYHLPNLKLMICRKIIFEKGGIVFHSLDPFYRLWVGVEGKKCFCFKICSCN